MFWIFRKIFGLAVLAAIAFFVMQYSFQGRPIKDYLVDFYSAPLVQEAGRQAKIAVMRYLNQGPKTGGDQPAMDELKDDERAELESILKKAAK